MRKVELIKVTLSFNIKDLQGRTYLINLQNCVLEKRTKCDPPAEPFITNTVRPINPTGVRAGTPVSLQVTAHAPRAG